jgi:hypothetical protein
MYFPIGTPIAWAGTLYPLCLIFALCGQLFRTKPIGAAGAPVHSDPRTPLFAAIGTVSACVACVSLLVSGYYEYIAFNTASSSIAQLAIDTATGDLSPAAEKAAAIFASIAYAMELAMAVLLLFATCLFLKSNPLGKALHLLYVPLKLITAVIGVCATYAFLNSTPWGWAVIGPALFAAPFPFIYPIVLVIVLLCPAMKSPSGAN